MHILYVTTNFNGLDDLVFKGKCEATGMPAQIKVLEALVHRGDKIDMIIIHDYEENTEINLGSSWVQKIETIHLVSRPTSHFGKVIFLYTVRKILTPIFKQRTYDFVYFQGVSGAPAIPLATKKRIACGQRLYGSLLYKSPDMSRIGFITSCISHFSEFLAFWLRKDFLLATDDGSRSDLAIKAIWDRTPPYDFQLWSNGVDFPTKQKIMEIKQKSPRKKPYLFYGARFDSWKRQDRAVNILKVIRDEGYDVELVFAGGVFDTPFYEYVQQLVIEYQLSDFVTYLGAIPQSDMWRYHANSIATLFLYDWTSRGNSFFEAMACESVAIASNNGSVDDLVINGETGFICSSDKDASEAIIALFNNSNLRQIIGEKARCKIEETLPSWEERVQRELDYIDRVVAEKQTLSSEILHKERHTA